MVGCAQAEAVVAVEVFGEGEEVFEVGVLLEFGEAAVEGAVAAGVFEEEVGEARGEFEGDIPEVFLNARVGGAFDGEGVAVVEVELLEGFDEEVVEGEPDGAAPVGVAAEEAGGGFGGFVIEGVEGAIEVEAEGVVFVEAGDGAQAVGGEEFVFIEGAGEDGAEAVFVDDGKEAAVGLARGDDGGDGAAEFRAVLLEPFEALGEIG